MRGRSENHPATLAPRMNGQISAATNRGESAGAAGREQHFTGYPMGIAGGKKHHGADYILGLSQPTERRSVDQLLDHGSFENADRMRPLRLGGAGSDDVHTNVSGAELFRKHV